MHAHGQHFQHSVVVGCVVDRRFERHGAPHALADAGVFQHLLQLGDHGRLVLALRRQEHGAVLVAVVPQLLHQRRLLDFDLLHAHHRCCHASPLRHSA
jgi:maltooligosyltrehalose synthase